MEECGPCPVFTSFTLASALQLRKKHGKTSVRVRKTSVRLGKPSVRVQYTYYQNTHTLQNPHIRGQSIKKPNFWNSEPTGARSRLVMVELCSGDFNPLNAELNPICYLLALLGAQHFLHVSRIKLLTLRLLMSYIYIYIYGAPILDVSRSHTTTHHSR